MVNVCVLVNCLSGLGLKLKWLCWVLYSCMCRLRLCIVIGISG